VKTSTIGATALLFLAATLAGTVLVGCGDDTQAVAGDGGHDAGLADVVQPTGDAGDGGDGACNYAAFVLGLIANHTNGTDQPSSDLGQGCVDDQNQAEFQSLFP
jgi:hypothetical protein